MDLKQKQVLVVGTGLSGIGACGLLLSVGARPVLFDGNEKADRAAIQKKLPKGAEVPLYVGALPEQLYEALSLAVISPGVPADGPIATALQAHGIPVWGEVELAWRYSSGRVSAITGTNGKTTTTALLGKIMGDNFGDVHVVGNIGTPYTSAALNTKDDSVIVAEISSFQLETAQTFHPAVSAVLNITPDHLDRHHTMENYAAVKESIGANQTAEDFIILNYDDAATRAMGERAWAKPIYFSRRERLRNGVFSDGVYIYVSEQGEEKPLLPVSELRILGDHNVENAMAAIAMALAFGVPQERVIASVKAFQAVPHRIEFVGTIGGVDYYNDSKGTNTDAAIKGIKAMKKPTCLIGGGYDKDAAYDDWIESFDGRVKLLVLLGATRDKIAACASAHGFTDIVFADSMEEAVRICAEEAQPGDAVLLSPACASWGMFDNYEQRGDVFKKLVHGLKR